MTLLQVSLIALCFLPADPPDFEAEIVPLLTRQGCNSGACHGAAAGRGGLHLSLFGASPDQDFSALAEQHDGRRIHRDRPERSLLLRKPAGQMNHGGGERFTADSPEAALLLNWIRNGLPRDPGYRVQQLTLSPPAAIVKDLPAQLSFSVTAVSESRGQEDVTKRAQISTTDPSAVRIIGPGTLQVLRSGQHTVLIRYLDQVESFRIRAPYVDTAPGEVRTAVPQKAAAAESPVDDQIGQVLQQMHLSPAPTAAPAVWLRRVTLDLCGRLPTITEQQRFLKAPDDDARRQVVDTLLQENEFVNLWTQRFARILRLHSLPNDRIALQTSRDWLKDCIRQDRGFDAVMHDIVTATGDSHQNGAAGFSRMVPDARVHAELVGSAFAGIQIGCANCHDHPLDRWKQDDYHGLAAIFARLQRGQVVELADRGFVTNVRTGDPAIPRIPGERDLTQSGDHRAAVSNWLLQAPEHLLARNLVNRVWAFLFGRGLVDPVDNLSQTNPASHPRLLQELAEGFASNGYRLKNLLRTLVLTKTYARQTALDSNSTARISFYAARQTRPLEPAVFLNCVAAVTGVGFDFPQHETSDPLQIIDPLTPAPALDAIGRCQGAEICDATSGGSADSLAIVLHRLNGELINSRLRDPTGRLQTRLREQADTAQIVAEFLQLALCRPVTGSELDYWNTQLLADSAMQRQELLEDFVWSLLNSRSFRENR